MLQSSLRHRAPTLMLDRFCWYAALANSPHEDAILTLLLINLGALSTSDPVRCVRGKARMVATGGTCDRGIWTKPLALAADAGFATRFQSMFALKALPEAGFGRLWMLMTFP
jgi:hypothetical protein